MQGYWQFLTFYDRYQYSYKPVVCLLRYLSMLVCHIDIPTQINYISYHNINDPARRFTYGHLVTTFAWFKPIRSNGFEQYMYCYIYYSPPSSRINSVLGSDGRCVQKTGT